MANCLPVTVENIRACTALARSYLYGHCKNVSKAIDVYAAKLLHYHTGDDRITQYPDVKFCSIEINKTSSSNNTFNWKTSNGSIVMTGSSDIVNAVCTNMYTEEFTNLSSGNTVSLQKTPSCIFIVTRNGLQQSGTQYTITGKTLSFNIAFGVSTGGGTLNTEDIRIIYLSTE